MNDRAFGRLFEEPGSEDGVSGCGFNFQLVIAGGKALQIVEGDAVDADLQAGAQHADDLAMLQISQQNNAVNRFFARYLEHEIMIERIRVDRNFNCHNHSLWDLVLGIKKGSERGQPGCLGSDRRISGVRWGEPW